MPFLRYTLYRLGVLLVAFVILRLVGASSLVAGVVAVVVAALVAYLFLRGPRDATTAWLADRAEARKAHRTQSRFARQVAEDEAAEDAAVEGAGDDGR